MQKIRKFLCRVWKILLEKLQFLAQFWSFDPPGGQTKFFPNMTPIPKWSTYYCPTSCRKSEKSYVAFGRYCGKTPFLAQFWPFDPPGGQTRFFPNMTPIPKWSTYYCLTSCRKSEKSYVAFGRYCGKTQFLAQFWPFDPHWWPNKIFSKHESYTKMKHLLLSNFIQKIRKIQSSVWEILWKNSIFGPILTFWPPWWPNKIFPKYDSYTKMKHLLLSNFMQKIRKILCSVWEILWKNSIFGPILTFWPPWRGVKIFFQKSGSRHFLAFMKL